MMTVNLARRVQLAMRPSTGVECGDIYTFVYPEFVNACVCDDGDSGNTSTTGDAGPSTGVECGDIYTFVNAEFVDTCVCDDGDSSNANTTGDAEVRASEDAGFANVYISGAEDLHRFLVLCLHYVPILPGTCTVLRRSISPLWVFVLVFCVLWGGGCG